MLTCTNDRNAGAFVGVRATALTRRGFARLSEDGAM